MGRIHPSVKKQKQAELQEKFIAKSMDRQKAASSCITRSESGDRCKLSLRAIVKLANSLLPTKWKRLSHPNIVAALLMAPFIESPHRIVEPPPVLGTYNPISKNLVRAIMPADHPNFEGLCKYLGNVFGIWADYWPWSNVFAPMVLSPAFKYRSWACRGNLFLLFYFTTTISLYCVYISPCRISTWSISNR